MNTFQKYVAVCAVSLLAATGCGNKPKEIAPAKAGQRNDTCLAKNDCGDGLSCINQRCQPTKFDVQSTGKECSIFECETDTDCCGDRPSDAPAKCDGREVICDTPSIPGCNLYASCDSDVDCDGGTCGSGYCADTFGTCDSDADCTPTAPTCFLDLCDDGLTDCVTAADCPAVANTNTCTSKECSCQNPDYDPTASICDDPDCDNLCTKVCDTDSSRCVDDDSCETDADCYYQPGNICDSDGRCVQCESDDDCDMDNKEACNDVGFCERPCEFDQECGPFETCNTTSGECEYQGCKDNLDCVLYSSFADADRRLAQCKQGDDGYGECLLPCENDGHCGELETCTEGFCKYIGCDTDAQCDRLLGLNNQNVSDSKPYVSVGQCKAVEVTAP